MARGRFMCIRKCSVLVSVILVHAVLAVTIQKDGKLRKRAQAEIIV